jgi:hypothetical protein
LHPIPIFFFLLRILSLFITPYFFLLHRISDFINGFSSFNLSYKFSTPLWTILITSTFQNFSTSYFLLPFKFSICLHPDDMEDMGPGIDENLLKDLMN